MPSETHFAGGLGLLLLSAALMFLRRHWPIVVCGLTLTILVVVLPSGRRRSDPAPQR